MPAARMQSGVCGYICHQRVVRVLNVWKIWQAVVDVPPSLQRVVEFLLRVVDISQLYNVFYNAL